MRRHRSATSHQQLRWRAGEPSTRETNRHGREIVALAASIVCVHGNNFIELSFNMSCYVMWSVRPKGLGVIYVCHIYKETSYSSKSSINNNSNLHNSYYIIVIISISSSSSSCSSSSSSKKSPQYYVSKLELISGIFLSRGCQQYIFPTLFKICVYMGAV